MVFILAYHKGVRILSNRSAIWFEPWLDVLKKVGLFRGIPGEELPGLLAQLAPRIHEYPAGSMILYSGQENSCIYIVLEGEIAASKTTPGGQTVTMAHMGKGGVFGDVLSGSSTPSPVTVTALKNCKVLALPYERIIAPGCSDAAHSMLLRNLVETISDKYFSICRRVDVLILKSLRAKLCAWLLEQYEKAKSPMFTTDWTRAQLAEYLNCERSALSRELGRMQAEGLLETHRGSFKLHSVAAIQEQYEGALFP